LNEGLQIKINILSDLEQSAYLTQRQHKVVFWTGTIRALGNFGTLLGLIGLGAPAGAGPAGGAARVEVRVVGGLAQYISPEETNIRVRAKEIRGMLMSIVGFLPKPA